MQKAKYLFVCVLLVISFSVFSQNQLFDSLANEINRISYSKKTKSLEILDKMYQIANTDKDSALFLARCMYEESILNVIQGIVDTSMTERIKKRLIKPDLSLPENALLLSALGINIYNLGNYSEAFTVNLRALEVFKKLENHRYIGKTLNALGNICSTIGYINLAEYYYAEAITYLTPDFYEYYLAKSNLFQKFSKNNENMAIDSMIYLIEEVEDSKHKDILPLLYLNMGSFLLNSLPEKSFLYFTKLHALKIDNPKLMAYSFINEGVYYRIMNNNRKAINHFRAVQSALEKQFDFENLSMLYGLMSQTFESLNMPDSALYYARKNEEVSKIIHSNTIAIETHQKYINTVLESSQKDLTIAQQSINLKNKQILIIVIVLTSTILVISLFLLLINRQKKLKAIENRELTAKLEHEKKVQQYEKRQQKFEREKQKEILEAKTREISSYSLLVSNKNILLKQIQELNNHAINNKEIAIKSLSKIDEIITGSLNIDDEWENFKGHFEKVHPHFFKKLKQLCGELTAENLKICAYIKMGMTTKQIAQLQNVTDRAVVISRNRIKKKLKLSDKENLINYIGTL